MRFLDNVLQGFIDNAGTDFARATYAAMRERSVGLGVMGFHSFLQANNVPLESVMAKVWNKKMFKHIRGQCDEASQVAGQGARRLPGCRRLRLRGALLQQARDRADRLDLDHLRRRLARHRAVGGQRLQPQDPVGLVRGAQPVPREDARAEGQERRGHLDLDHRQPGLGAASRLPRRPREGGVQDRVRDRPALAGRARAPTARPSSARASRSTSSCRPTCTSATCTRST